MIHSYSIDLPERRQIPFFIAVLAIIAAWILNVNFQFSWWIDAPSVIGFYGVFYAVFDKYLWNLKFFHHIGFLKTPVINGVWEGEITSSFDQNINKKAALRIYQSWRNIEIILETENSTSCSLAASFLTNTGDGAILVYQYQNDPGAVAPSTMQQHYGTARLVLKNKNTLMGEYYSGRGRQNAGTLSFTRKK